MSEALQPDICVIGGGAAGLSVAVAAAAFGVSTVLIEKGAMGGDCLNHGCVPSKSLIAAADLAHRMRGAGAFGFAAVEPQVNFGKLHSHIHDVIAGIAPTDSAERLRGLGVNVIGAEARFTDRRTVIAGDRPIRARRFVVATGSTPAVPPIPGLAEVGFHTNETIFGITRKPNHLVVIGAGPVGVELSQALRRLGVQVTVLEAAEPLAGEDPELVAHVLDGLARDGVALRAGVEVAEVASRRGGVRVILGGWDNHVDASDVLIATGRRPSVNELGLDKAGVDYDSAGISVDAQLRSSNRRIFAAGDAVADAPRLTHVASLHAGIVIRNAVFRLRAKVDYEHVPRVVFTDPELAQVGLTEAEARHRHRNLRIVRWPYSENDRARTERRTDGLIKVVATPAGRILGAGIVGAEAGELIQTWALALRHGLGMKAMSEMVVSYPTRGEIGKRAAVEYYRPDLTRPALRRIISALRLFG